jgi:hypothetical protein
VSVGPHSVGSTWSRRENPVPETSCLNKRQDDGWRRDCDSFVYIICTYMANIPTSARLNFRNVCWHVGTDRSVSRNAIYPSTQGLLPPLSLSVVDISTTFVDLISSLSERRPSVADDRGQVPSTPPPLRNDAPQHYAGCRYGRGLVELGLTAIILLVVGFEVFSAVTMKNVVKILFLPHRKHITSPLQSSAN